MDQDSVVASLRVVNHLNWLIPVEMNYYPHDNLSQWIEDGCPGEYDYDNDRRYPVEGDDQDLQDPCDSEDRTDGPTEDQGAS